MLLYHSVLRLLLWWPQFKFIFNSYQTLNHSSKVYDNVIYDNFDVIFFNVDTKISIVKLMPYDSLPMIILKYSIFIQFSTFILDIN